MKNLIVYRLLSANNKIITRSLRISSSKFHTIHYTYIFNETKNVILYYIK